MRTVEIIRKPVEPYGQVIQDDKKIEVLVFGPPQHKHRGGSDYAEIEIAQHDDGLWMWSTSYRIGTAYCGYRVGPKWGCFTKTRIDAIAAACNEIAKSSPGPDVMNWLDKLSGPQQMELFT